MRDKIIKLLMLSKGYVSGEKIAQMFNITRAGVWKHIKVLKQAGCEIECRPNRGYKLISVPDSISPDIIKAYDNTGTVAKYNIKCYQSLESTNDTAKQLAGGGAPHATIVVADEQTKGRGRSGNNWFSPKSSGIYCSIIVRPRMSPSDTPKLSLIAGLAAQRAISALTDEEVLLKWPNDVLLNGKKICGILTEMSATIDSVDYVVIGIGINVADVNFPPEIEAFAGSINKIAAKQIKRPQILAALIVEFFDIYDKFSMNNDFIPIISEYTANSAIMGARIQVKTINDTQEGVCLGFDKDGALILEKTDGSRRRIIAGEVSIRRFGTPYV